VSSSSICDYLNSKGEFKLKKTIFFKRLLGLMSITIFLQGIAISSISFEVVGEKVGSDDIKAYGMALEAKTTTATVQSGTIPNGTGTTYYFDDVSGNDSNNGTSEGTAWKSISKVSSKTYQPGDKILFNAGGTWTAPAAPRVKDSLPSNIDTDNG
jgi:hypothetical protein